MTDRVKLPAVNKPDAVATRCADKPSLSSDQQWQQESQQTIAAYNQLVDEQGVFSEGIRAF